ncbi:GNAT family N-acetyltransferase [Brevibacillus daliensis]|uniref:GNAT family N-acetyltransferase n=1 Tax=Brevibacillus daliensis TaxID=2892995 RepID=UPI001E54AEA5|nr:GNAT family N-acetyltransferase [Brevibacillus daliensis]
MDLFNLQIIGPRLYLQLLSPLHAESLLTYFTENRQFHEPFVPVRDDSFFSLEHVTNLVNQKHLVDTDQKYMFGLFTNNEHQLIGKLTLSQICRGPFQNAYLGYDVHHASQGHGYMTEAVKLLIPFAFRSLSLHRIQANVMPHNTASISVLTKAGFTKEGFAPHYLKINNVWEDHLMFGITQESYDNVLTETVLIPELKFS